jgi:hypothetical protein
VNAAFLLVTSAWLAGQAAPAPAPAKPMPPPVYAAPGATAGSGCCNTASCDSCGESCGGGGLFARLRARFCRHDDCCDTCTTGCGHAPAPAPAPAAACGCEEECCGGGLLARLRSWFHRGGCEETTECCGASTNCCGTAGAPHAAGAAPLPPRPPEPIKAPKATEPPKEMPKGTTSGATYLGPQSVVTPATTLILDR